MLAAMDIDCIGNGIENFIRKALEALNN
jgi:hypothetical protein